MKTISTEMKTAELLHLSCCEFGDKGRHSNKRSCAVASPGGSTPFFFFFLWLWKSLAGSWGAINQAGSSPLSNHSWRCQKNKDKARCECLGFVQKELEGEGGRGERKKAVISQNDKSVCTSLRVLAHCPQASSASSASLIKAVFSSSSPYTPGCVSDSHSIKIRKKKREENKLRGAASDSPRHAPAMPSARRT